MKTIYDFGSNNGDDLPYYFMKADRVVAVEANPVLCNSIRERFRREIQNGKLIVENYVLCDTAHGGDVEFFIHKRNHVLSQFPRPSGDSEKDYEKVVLPARSACDIVQAHGDPYYIKVDIEHYDAMILKSLFKQGIVPPYLSAECHSIDVFALLIAEGGYKSFKLVDGSTVSQVYANRLIIRDSENDSVKYSFPDHSAGPFGSDIDGPWMTADNLMHLLACEGFGWKDVHATNEEPADVSCRPSSHASFVGKVTYDVVLDAALRLPWREKVRLIVNVLSWAAARAFRVSDQRKSR